MIKFARLYQVDPEWSGKFLKTRVPFLPGKSLILVPYFSSDNNNKCYTMVKQFKWPQLYSFFPFLGSSPPPVLYKYVKFKPKN